MIHKQYMDLLNTSPTFYIFLFCVNASLQGVKAIVDTKKNSASLCPHTAK